MFYVLTNLLYNVLTNFLLYHLQVLFNILNNNILIKKLPIKLKRTAHKYIPYFYKFFSIYEFKTPLYNSLIAII